MPLFVRGSLALAFLIGFCVVPTAIQAAEFWVSPEGADDNPGTRVKPFASVGVALRQARELRRLRKLAINEPVHVILEGGIYPLADSLLVRAADSGTAGSPTIIEAAPGASVALSGGIPITGWKKVSGTVAGMPAAALRNVWEANTPTIGGRPLQFRQLWVNGRKAVRARRPNAGSMDRLISWDPKKQEAWIPATAVEGVGEPAGMEMVIDQDWEIAVLRVNTVRLDGDEACLTFRQPESRLEFEHPWPPVIVKAHYQAPFFLANNVAFLDAPREWFEDARMGKLFYRPRAGEDPPRAEITAPAVKTLVCVTGSLDRPVENVQFRDITFEYTTWLRPSREGDVPLQAGMFFLDAYRLKPPGTAYHPGLDNAAWVGRPPSGVSVKNADHIVFERCRFEHMAGTGLDFQSGTHDDLIEGCVFSDLGGNGIQMGKFSDPGIETHVPYNPGDQRVICARERIFDNVLTDCGSEDWGSVGICVGYAREVTIEHNDLFDLPYTGISVGWGWNKEANCMRENRIIANRIHNVATRMGDTGGIYTLSAQPGTVISRNAIYGMRLSRYVPDPNHWYYLYLDEGSSFITVSNNWCSSAKFMKNANGPGNIWENNGPTVSPKIKEAAGLQPGFQNLLSP